jgi:VanZ family protein
MELASGRRSAVVVVIAVVTACYWLAMFVGTHLPVTLDPFQNPNSLDKLQHLTAFAGLSLLLCGLGTAWGGAMPRLAFIVLGLIALYGVVDELTQAFVPHRQPDVRDWLANMVGAGLGIAVFLLVQQMVAIAGQRRSKPT